MKHTHKMHDVPSCLGSAAAVVGPPPSSVSTTDVRKCMYRQVTGLVDHVAILPPLLEFLNLHHPQEVIHESSRSSVIYPIQKHCPPCTLCTRSTTRETGELVCKGILADFAVCTPLRYVDRPGRGRMERPCSRAQRDGIAQLSKAERKTPLGSSSVVTKAVDENQMPRFTLAWCFVPKAALSRTPTPLAHIDVDGTPVADPQKITADGKPTKSAHPARFSPDDKFSRHRVTIKKR